MQSINNPRINAEAHYSSLGRNITMRLDLSNLPRRQQADIFGGLLRDSGVLEALAKLRNKDQVLKAMDDAFAAYIAAEQAVRS